jgi:hypothetical protein
MLLSAVTHCQVNTDTAGFQLNVIRLTPEQEPKYPPPNLSLNRIKTLIRRLFVHMQSDGDMSCLAKTSMRRRIMSLAEVVYSIAL